jgi:hypothetical protein
LCSEQAEVSERSSVEACDRIDVVLKVIDLAGLVSSHG